VTIPLKPLARGLTGIQRAQSSIKSFACINKDLREFPETCVLEDARVSLRWKQFLQWQNELFMEEDQFIFCPPLIFTFQYEQYSILTSEKI
jgi:hypothetical protein